ncbi:hypothetical protein C1645_834704 [Glomus cerebriforme]|uniref:Uncharacterized protein n=1 Tax=Glomus cerebriforme TaxID=658196 RepID=A0A397SJ71_9GLOM|nr:hypothetical protein C1645_834704 [Glomus cerebriforme]
MCRRSDSSFQSAMVESDTVEIVTEHKVIQFSTNEDLMSIIWTTNPKMKIVFSLKADDYNGLPLFDRSVKDTLKEIRSLVIDEFIVLIFDGEVKVYLQYKISGSYGKKPVDWVIKVGNTIITVTKAKKENINQDIIQNAVQLQTSIQCNSKKCSYDMADLHENVMYGIVLQVGI